MEMMAGICDSAPQLNRGEAGDGWIHHQNMPREIYFKKTYQIKSYTKTK